MTVGNEPHCMTLEYGRRRRALRENHRVEAELFAIEHRVAGVR